MIKDRKIVDTRRNHHKQVPNRVGAWDFPVRFKEPHSQNVQEAAQFQFTHSTELVSTHYYHKRWSHPHHQIEASLQAFIPLVIQLLVQDTSSGQQPNQPFCSKKDGRMYRRTQTQPRVVGARDEYVYHCTVTSVKHVLELAGIWKKINLENTPWNQMLGLFQEGRCYGRQIFKKVRVSRKNEFQGNCQGSKVV